MLRLVFESETVELLLPNLEHSFRFFKSSLKIRRTTVFGMSNVSAINHDVTFRSSLTILLTASMFSWVRLVVGRPLRSCPSLTLYPLETIFTTQKLLFHLMLHHCKPSESGPHSL